MGACKQAGEREQASRELCARQGGGAHLQERGVRQAGRAHGAVACVDDGQLLHAHGPCSRQGAHEGGWAPMRGMRARPTWPPTIARACAGSAADARPGKQAARPLTLRLQQAQVRCHPRKQGQGELAAGIPAGRHDLRLVAARHAAVVAVRLLHGALLRLQLGWRGGVRGPVPIAVRLLAAVPLLSHGHHAAGCHLLLVLLAQLAWRGDAVLPDSPPFSHWRCRLLGEGLAHRLAHLSPRGARWLLLHSAALRGPGTH